GGEAATRFQARIRHALPAESLARAAIDRGQTHHVPRSRQASDRAQRDEEGSAAPRARSLYELHVGFQGGQPRRHSSASRQRLARSESDDRAEDLRLVGYQRNPSIRRSRCARISSFCTSEFAESSTRAATLKRGRCWARDISATASHRPLDSRTLGYLGKG